MLADSLIPVNIFNEFLSGLTNPELIYSERMDKISRNENNTSRLISILSIFFSYSKLLFLFYFIYYWKQLSFFKKNLSIAYCFLFLSPGVSSGTNSVVFYFFIFICFNSVVFK